MESKILTHSIAFTDSSRVGGNLESARGPQTGESNPHERVVNAYAETDQSGLGGNYSLLVVKRLVTVRQTTWAYNARRFLLTVRPPRLLSIRGTATTRSRGPDLKHLQR